MRVKESAWPISDVRLLAIVIGNHGHLINHWDSLDRKPFIDWEFVPRTQEYRGQGCGCGWCN